MSVTFELWTSIVLVHIALPGTAEKMKWQDVGLGIRVQLWTLQRHCVRNWIPSNILPDVYWERFLKEIIHKIEIIALPVGVKITSLQQNPNRLLSQQQQLQPQNTLICLCTGKLLITWTRWHYYISIPRVFLRFLLFGILCSVDW